MTTPPEYPASNTAVQAHLAILQSIVTRMATNSAACKAWCISLVSAIIVLVADKGKPQFSCLATIPVVLFFLLDAYYLALEKMFRKSYEDFVRKVHGACVAGDDLFEVKPTGDWGRTLLASLGSFSVWPFYLVLSAIATLAMAIAMAVP